MPKFLTSSQKLDQIVDRFKIPPEAKKEIQLLMVHSMHAHASRFEKRLKQVHKHEAWNQIVGYQSSPIALAGGSRYAE